MAITLTPGETLRVERIRRGLSQLQMGQLLGCTGQYVGQIERGILPSIGLEIAFAIQREIGIPADSWLKVAA